MDDQTLVQRVTDGDREAFADIYSRYAGPLHNFLWWVLQDRGQADAALLDTFAVAGARLQELGDPSKLRSWLFAIAAREALHGHHLQMAVSGDHEDVDGGEFGELVQASARQLTPQERALLDLRYRHGLTGEELADAIGVKPDHATTLLTQLTDRVESSLGPMLASRFSRKNCAVLASIVLTHDEGPLDAKLQRRVAEHTADCEICGEWRQRVGIAKVLAAAPSLPLPPDLGERALAEFTVAEPIGRRWSPRRSGFPKPLVAEHDRRRLGGVAAALVLLIAVAAFLLTRDGGTQQVASVGATSTTRPATSTTRPITTTVPSTTTSIAPDGTAPGAGAEDTTSGSSGTVRATNTTAATGSGSGSGSGGTGTGSGSGGGGTGGGSGTTTPTPTSPPATDPTVPDTTTIPEPPPTTAPDKTGPSISDLRVSPTSVRANSDCASGDPAQATVTVQVSDPSGVERVEVQVAPGAGSKAMTPIGGGTYTATVGPFSLPTAIPGGVVVVQATDTRTNSSVLTTPLALTC